LTTGIQITGEEKMKYEISIYEVKKYLSG